MSRLCWSACIVLVDSFLSNSDTLSRIPTSCCKQCAYVVWFTHVHWQPIQTRCICVVNYTCSLAANTKNVHLCCNLFMFIGSQYKKCAFVLWFIHVHCQPMQRMCTFVVIYTCSLAANTNNVHMRCELHMFTGSQYKQCAYVLSFIHVHGQPIRTMCTDKCCDLYQFMGSQLECIFVR